MDNIDLIENDDNLHDIIEDESHGIISEDEDDKKSFVDDDDDERVQHDDEDDDDIQIDDDDDIDDESIFNEESIEENIYNKNIIEIPFDKTKHLQHLTLNEMTRIVININEMINNNVLQIPLNDSKSKFIYDIIIYDKMEIVIKRPINLTTVVIVPLSQLKINCVKLNQKLIKLFGN